MRMSYKLTFESKPGFLHAVVTGRNAKENVMGYLEDVRRECAARHCDRVLIEERLEGPRLGLVDVFEIASESGSGSAAMFPTIAYVDVNAVGTLMKFAGEVAAKRWINVQVFSTVTEAERWLRALSGTESGADHPGDTEGSHR
jgi:hypothetical protein